VPTIGNRVLSTPIQLSTGAIGSWTCASSVTATPSSGVGRRIPIGPVNRSIHKVNEAVARIENSKKAEQWMMDRPGIQVDEGRPAFEMPDPIARIDGAAHGARMDLSGPAPRLDPRRQR